MMYCKYAEVAIIIGCFFTGCKYLTLIKVTSSRLSTTGWVNNMCFAKASNKLPSRDSPQALAENFVKFYGDEVKSLRQNMKVRTHGNNLTPDRRNYQLCRQFEQGSGTKGNSLPIHNSQLANGKESSSHATAMKYLG